VKNQGFCFHDQNDKAKMAATKEEIRTSRINRFIPFLSVRPVKPCHMFARTSMDIKQMNTLMKVPLAADDFVM
jgi:hypothetical protein